MLTEMCIIGLCGGFVIVILYNIVLIYFISQVVQ
jgi:hypothetical protein